jgi:hypothetical protein
VKLITLSVLVDVKNAWRYASIPPYVFMFCCLIDQREVSLTFK